MEGVLFGDGTQVKKRAPKHKDSLEEECIKVRRGHPFPEGYNL